MRGVLDVDSASLSRMLRCAPEEITRAIAELERYNVFSRGRDVDPCLPPNAIVNRRMFRDWIDERTLSEKRSQAGRIGGVIGGIASGESKARHGNMNAQKRKANAKQNIENAKQTQSKIEANAKQNVLSEVFENVALKEENAKQTQSTRARASLELELKSEIDQEIKTPLPPDGGTAPESPDSLLGVEAPDPAQPTRFAAEVRDAWNEMARDTGLPLCRDLTRDRQRKIGARAKEHFWRDNWRAALAALPRDDFRCGREVGKTWKADIDYFLRPDSVAKILEKAGAEKPKLTYGMTLADLADIPENSFRRRPKEEPKP